VAATAFVNREGIRSSRWSVPQAASLSYIASFSSLAGWNAMPASSMFLAWIEPSDGREFLAAFVAAMALRRKPATHRSASPDEARRWVDVRAAELGMPVEWVDHPPSPAS
jgi:hypothetical protein